MDRALPGLASALPRLLQPRPDRLLGIDTGTALPLVAERFTGREGICTDFRFEVDCLSPDAGLDTGPLLGRAVTLQLQQADGHPRAWHGHCTRVQALGGDGGLARYRLRIEPWTAFLRLRRNALVFQDLDALGVVERVLDDYPQAALRVDASRTLPVPAITTQYRESDHGFVFRLLASAGLAWRFDHESGDDGHRHVLVVHDRDAATPDCTTPVLRFHRSDIAETRDAIQHFADRRQATASVFTAASWQPEQVEAVAATLHAAAGPHLPGLEVYATPRAGHLADRSAADDLAGWRVDALRLPRRLHAGAGSARTMAPGHAFTLDQHPELGGQRFVPVVIEHLATNNLGSGIVELLQAPELERGSYRNRFLAVPADTAIAPTPPAKPTAPGLQTARVVGLPDAAVTSTRDHQVRIQFPWQRGRRPNPGGLTDASSGARPEGHAPGDHTSGTWVRVAEWTAGPNWGSHALPRIGSEVLIEFLHGDIDQPVVTGQLYNGEVAPPFALAEASNHPGTLSGLHTQSLDGGGTQQWLVDDATGQLRQRLHTSLAESRLELGYLVEHDDARRGTHRGQGFDFATLGWANLRAGQGVLLSTTARPRATSTQMDATEAVAQLRGAERTAQSLADAAEASGVAPLAANGGQSDFIALVDPGQSGRYEGSAGGQATRKPADGQCEGGDPVERLARPVLLAESPDAIALATDASALAYAGGNLHLTAQQDLHLAAGQTFAGVSGRPLALFAQHGPVKAIAANGPLSLQAHDGPLELLADQSVTVTATEERIDVLAKEKVVLRAGNTEVCLEGGDIRFRCAGTFTVKAGQAPFEGGAQGAPLPMSLPMSPSSATAMDAPAPASQPADSPPTLSASKTACCQFAFPDYEQIDATIALSGSYDLCDASGKKILGASGNPIPLEYANSEGRMDLEYRADTTSVTVRTRVRLLLKDWYALDGIGGKVLVDRDTGNPVSVPYNADDARKVRRGSTPIREVTRPGGIDASAGFKSAIEGTLNQDAYLFRADQCTREDCSFRVPVRVVVDFVSEGSTHHLVNLFPEATRADSGNLGEANVELIPGPNGQAKHKIQPEHVAAHEAGHWIGWPDEYFEDGGAVHHRYVKADRTIDVALTEPTNDWKRHSTTNLMGDGVYLSRPGTPEYYFDSFRKWFESKTGLHWRLTK